MTDLKGGLFAVKKKLLTAALTAIIVIGGVFSTFAAPITATEWRTVRTEGYEIADGSDNADKDEINPAVIIVIVAVAGVVIAGIVVATTVTKKKK